MFPFRRRAPARDIRTPVQPLMIEPTYADVKAYAAKHRPCSNEAAAKALRKQALKDAVPRCPTCAADPLLASVLCAIIEGL